MELVVVFRDPLFTPLYIAPRFRPYVGCGKEGVPEKDYGTSRASLDPPLT